MRSYLTVIAKLCNVGEKNGDLYGRIGLLRLNRCGICSPVGQGIQTCRVHTGLFVVLHVLCVNSRTVDNEHGLCLVGRIRKALVFNLIISICYVVSIGKVKSHPTEYSLRQRRIVCIVRNVIHSALTCAVGKAPKVSYALVIISLLNQFTIGAVVVLKFRIGIRLGVLQLLGLRSVGLNVTLCTKGTAGNNVLRFDRRRSAVYVSNQRTRATLRGNGLGNSTLNKVSLNVHVFNRQRRKRRRVVVASVCIVVRCYSCRLLFCTKTSRYAASTANTAENRSHECRIGNVEICARTANEAAASEVAVFLRRSAYNGFNVNIVNVTVRNLTESVLTLFKSSVSDLSENRSGSLTVTLNKGVLNDYVLNSCRITGGYVTKNTDIVAGYVYVQTAQYVSLTVKDTCEVCTRNNRVSNTGREQRLCSRFSFYAHTVPTVVQNDMCVQFYRHLNILSGSRINGNECRSVHCTCVQLFSKRKKLLCIINFQLIRRLVAGFSGIPVVVCQRLVSFSRECGDHTCQRQHRYQHYNCEN